MIKSFYPIKKYFTTVNYTGFLQTLPQSTAKKADETVSKFGSSVDDLGILLEKINKEKDRVVFAFLKDRWPRQITPNHLTIARIGIGIVLFFLLFNFRNEHILILPLFFIGALTDLLDGVLARGFKQITRFGEITDPIADRVLILPMVFYSLMSYNLPLFFLIIVSEIVNAIISLSVIDKPINFGNNIFGKTKMALQSVIFMAILLFWPNNPGMFFIGLLWLSLIFMGISIIFKLIAIQLHYEAATHKNPQYAVREKGAIKAH